MAISTGINRQDGAPKVRDRVRWLYVLAILAFLALITRLAFLQIFQGELYSFLSENNRIRLKRIPGTRGMMFDRQGQLLVDSRPSFDLIFTPEDTQDAKDTLGQLARYLGRDEKELLDVFEANKERLALEKVTFGKNKEWATVVRVENPPPLVPPP